MTTRIKQDQIDLHSIALTGISTAPTASLGTDTEQIANTKFVINEIANNVIGPPSSVIGNIVLFAGITGKTIKDSGFTIGTSVPSDAIFTDTNNKVTQTINTTNAEYPLLLAPTAGQSETITSTCNFGIKLTANPSTGVLTAISFKGDLDGNATTATSATDSTKLPLAGGTMTGTLTGQRIIGISTSTGNDYASGGFEVRGNGTTNTIFPNIGFHQPGLYASSIQLRGSADFRFYAQEATSYANITVNNISASGDITASRVYNAVYNDYAECFNNKILEYNKVKYRIIELDENENTILANEDSVMVIGIVSDSYGHLLGGDDEDIKNGVKIPIGLAGVLYVDSKEIVDIKNRGKFITSAGDGYAKVNNNPKLGTIVGKIIGIDIINNRYKIIITLI